MLAMPTIRSIFHKLSIHKFIDDRRKYQKLEYSSTLWVIDRFIKVLDHLVYHFSNMFV